MPAIPSSSVPGASSGGASSSTASNSGGSGGDAFGKLLQGNAGKEPAATGKGKGSATTAANGKAGNGPAGDAGSPASTPATTDSSTPGSASSETPPAQASTGASRTNGDKDTAPETDPDAAPWPPLGLAGLVLATAVPAEPPPPTAVLPDDADGGALPAAPALPPALTAAAAPAPANATASAAAAPAPAAAEDAPTTAAALAALLPARGAGDGKQDDGLDLSTLAPPPVQGASPTHDLRSAVANAVAFAAEPTPTPVLGDEGFDQAIGARVGWLADQKIGHAHIRLSPDELGAVDVRLQLNGDKVHASFSSPHVDVRQALESSLPRLRELLGEQGFQLAHADVGQQPASGQGDGTAGRGQGRGDGGDGEPSHGETVLPAAQLIRQRGLLDAYA